MHLAKLESILRERKQDTVKTQQMYEWVYLARQAHEQEVAQLVEAFEPLSDLFTYLEDYAQLGGGAMKQKYGDDPMQGFNNILKRSRPLAHRIRAELDKIKEGNDGR